MRTASRPWSLGSHDQGLAQGSHSACAGASSRLRQRSREAIPSRLEKAVSSTLLFGQRRSPRAPALPSLFPTAPPPLPLPTFRFLLYAPRTCPPHRPLAPSSSASEPEHPSQAMPKAPSVSSARPALRRNQVRPARALALPTLTIPSPHSSSRQQACLSCRKRKLVRAPPSRPAFHSSPPRTQKCDAARPHCGTCVKCVRSPIALFLSHSRAGPGHGRRRSASPHRWDMRAFAFDTPNRVLGLIRSTSHPTEPQCSYDPVEGLPIAANIDPTERIRQLEDQICESIALS